jgi:HEAT repeat protein
MSALAALKRLAGTPPLRRQVELRELLRQKEASELLPLLKAALADEEDASLRNTAMEALKCLGQEAVPVLRSILQGSRDGELRLFAAQLLGEIGSERALPELIANLKEDPHVNVRAACAEALGKLRHPKALQGLRQATRDEPWVAMAAVHAMGQIGGPEALKHIKEVIEEGLYVEMGIAALRDSAMPEALELLLRLAQQAHLADASLQALAELFLTHGLRPSPQALRPFVPWCLRNLQEHKAALLLLCLSQSEQGLPHYLQALGDEELQEHALEALLSLRKKAVVPLIEALKDTSRAGRPLMAKLLGILGEAEVLVRKFLQDEDPEVRVEVALAAAELKRPEALRALQRLARDPVEEVRQAALLGLKEAHGEAP